MIRQIFSDALCVSIGMSLCKLLLQMRKYTPLGLWYEDENILKWKTLRSWVGHIGLIFLPLVLYWGFSLIYAKSSDAIIVIIVSICAGCLWQILSKDTRPQNAQFLTDFRKLEYLLRKNLGLSISFDPKNKNSEEKYYIAATTYSAGLFSFLKMIKAYKAMIWMAKKHLGKGARIRIVKDGGWLDLFFGSELAALSRSITIKGSCQRQFDEVLILLSRSRNLVMGDDDDSFDSSQFFRIEFVAKSKHFID